MKRFTDTETNYYIIYLFTLALIGLLYGCVRINRLPVEKPQVFRFEAL